MKKLFLIRDSLENKISYYHLLLLLASLPFDRFYSHLILISFAVHTFIHLKRDTLKPASKTKIIVAQSVFLTTVLSTLYTINPAEAFSEWGKQITIFIFPLLFWLNPIDLKKYRQQLLLSFSLVCTATIIFLYADALITIRHYGLPVLTIFSGAFINHNFSEPIDMHATFFSMQAALALVYILSVLINEGNAFTRLFYFACSAILSAGLIQLCSKSVFIALLIVVNVALPYFLLTGAARWRFVVISASISTMVFVGIINEGSFKERYISELKQDLSKPAGGEATTDSRLARWAAAVEIIGAAPLKGYGAGSEIGLLQDAFFNKKLYNSYLNRLNAHSEYLSLLIKSGIVGLLIYLATLAYGFTVSLRENDLLLFAFLTLVSIVSLSENLLDVDKGIFFYAFFLSLFLFSYGSRKKRYRPLRP